MVFFPFIVPTVWLTTWQCSSCNKLHCKVALSAVFSPFHPLSAHPCPSTALSGEAAANLVDAAAQSHSLMGSQNLSGHACEEKEVAAR